MNEGENFVILQGKITYPKFTELSHGSGMFKGSLAIESDDGQVQYIGITAWSPLAEALSEVNSRYKVRVHGHIEKSTSDSKCKYCGGPDKKYWTNVMVDNFIVVK